MELKGYQISDVIGSGGMATVYRGMQLSLQRPVAIKVLNEQMRSEPEVRQAFEHEALIIARLAHPNIIPVIDRGTRSDGAPCFIMEYVNGVDLAQAVKGTELTLERKLDILLQVARALAYAHRNSVIHRDIKPGNIIIDRDWHVRVVDFGIALLYRETGELQDKPVNAAVAGVQARDSDLIMGSENYMAPETMDSATSATVQSDLYSFGVVAYELLTGRLPNRGLRAPSKFVNELPKDIERLVLECLAPEPEQRPKRAEELCDRLLLGLQGAHLDQQQAVRAKQTLGEKSFTLLDVLAESDAKASYVFVEANTQRCYVVTKQPRKHPSINTWKRMAGLKHPNWVTVQGVSENSSACVLVSDYMDGGTLSERLTQTLAPAQFLPWAQQIARGLSHAHDQGFWHGNLSATQVFFDEQQTLRLAGFADGDLQALSKKYRAKTPTPQFLDDIRACGQLFHRMLLDYEPRYHLGQLKVGKAFKRLPQGLQRLLISMLDENALNQIDKPVNQFMGRVSQQLLTMEDQLPTQVWTKKAPLKPAAQDSQQEKKKLLLFLLLVLLFLVLVDVGVITLFQMGLLG